MLWLNVFSLSSFSNLSRMYFTSCQDMSGFWLIALSESPHWCKNIIVMPVKLSSLGVIFRHWFISTELYLPMTVSTDLSSAIVQLRTLVILNPVMRFSSGSKAAECILLHSRTVRGSRLVETKKNLT